MEMKINDEAKINEDVKIEEVKDEAIEIQPVKEEAVEMTEEKANTIKPVIHMKLLKAATETFSDKGAMSRLKSVMDNLSEAGYLPIATSSDMEFNDAEDEDTVCMVSGMPITVKDLKNAKEGKYGSADVIYTEEDVTKAVQLAAIRIKQVDDFMDNLNAKIQLVFPNTTEFYSAITLPEDYRIETAITGRPPFSVNSNNPMFTATLNSLIDINKDENGNVDVLAVLSAYLDAKIKENLQEESKVIKRDDEGNPVEKIVTPEEVVEGMNKSKDENEEG